MFEDKNVIINVRGKEFEEHKTDDRNMSWVHIFGFLMYRSSSMNGFTEINQIYDLLHSILSKSELITKIIIVSATTMFLLYSQIKLKFLL
jgi:hypothetical protein